MEYHRVGNRCGIYKEILACASEARGLQVLSEAGFEFLPNDVVAIARALLGKARFDRFAEQSDAPLAFNCSGFAKWIYGQLGVWLPRYGIDQSQLGISIDLAETQAGDLIFTRGLRPRYLTRLEEGVGHVGIATGEGTVVHCTRRHSKNLEGVVETPIDEFLISPERFRGIRRILPAREQFLVVRVPEEYRQKIETSSDVRWFILARIEHNSKRE